MPRHTRSDVPARARTRAQRRHHTDRVLQRRWKRMADHRDGEISFSLVRSAQPDLLKRIAAQLDEAGQPDLADRIRTHDDRGRTYYGQMRLPATAFELLSAPLRRQITGFASAGQYGALREHGTDRRSQRYCYCYFCCPAAAGVLGNRTRAERRWRAELPHAWGDHESRLEED